MESKSLSLPYLLMWSFQSRISVPITDDEDCIIAVLAGCPNHVGWQQVHEEAAEALKTLHEKLKDPSEKDLENTPMASQLVPPALFIVWRFKLPVDSLVTHDEAFLN